MINKITEFDGVPIVCTTELKSIIGIPVSGELIESLGLTPKLKTKTGIFWRKCDVSLICDLIISHLEKIKLENE